MRAQGTAHTNSWHTSVSSVYLAPVKFESWHDPRTLFLRLKSTVCGTMLWLATAATQTLRRKKEAGSMAKPKKTMTLWRATQIDWPTAIAHVCVHTNSGLRNVGKLNALQSMHATIKWVVPNAHRRRNVRKAEEGGKAPQGTNTE
jgi:hypothetical protein